MKIYGFLNKEYEPPAPFVKVLLISKNLNIRKFLDLCIDTGASSTIILDKDVKYLRLNLKELKRAEKSIGGIGGLVDTYVIEDAKIIFKTEEGIFYEKNLSLFVGVHKTDKLTEYEKFLVAKLPSLLGRDIIREFNFIFNEKENIVLFEK
jgi:hypothetical protein